MADLAYMTVKIDGNDVSEGASNQDSIGTDYQEGDFENKILLRSFSQIVKQSFDPRSGAPKAASCEPVEITKQVDKTTPLLYQAWAQNQKCEEVVIELYRKEEGAFSEPFFKITLTDAYVTHMETVMPDRFNHGKDDTPHYDRVQFTFATIDWEHLKASTASNSTWRS